MFRHLLQNRLDNPKFKRAISFLLVFCFVIVLPFSAIASYAHMMLTQRLHENNESHLNHTVSSLDNIFHTCKTQTSLLFENNHEDFTTLANATDISAPNVTMASFRFNNIINSTTFNQDFFSDYFIYFPNSDIVFTPLGTYDSATYFEQHRIFEKYSESHFESLTKTSYKTRFYPPTDVFTADSSGSSILYSHCIPVAINPTGPVASDAVLVLLLDAEKLNTLLATHEQTSYTYIFDTYTNHILNHPTDTDYSELLNLTGQSYDSKTGVMTISKGTAFRILWEKSSVNHLLYICVEPQPLIFRQVSLFLLLTLFIISILLVLCIFLYRFFNSKLHSALVSVLEPIQQITETPSVSSQNDSDAVDFSTLIQAAEKLQKQQERTRPQMIQVFFSQLFQGTLEKNEIHSFCERFSLFTQDTHFAIWVMRTNFYLWENPYPTDEVSSFLTNVTTLLSQYGHTVSMNNASDFIVILSSTSADELDRKANELANLLKANTTQKTPERKCGRSSVFHDICEAYEHYCDTLTILETHGIANEQILYTENDISENVSQLLLPKQIHRIRTLAVNQPSECTTYIKELLTEFYAQNLAFSEYRNIITRLLFLLQEIIYEQNISFSSLSVFIKENELFSFTKRILLCKHLDELCLYLYAKLTELLQNRSEDKNSGEQILLTYINDNLRDVNLTMLADAIGMNPNYLSQYFKKHFGISFIDYITQLKIDKAKDMLIHTNLTCKAIGEELGYHDPNVFTRVFKKNESQTPNEYRRAHKELIL